MAVSYYNQYLAELKGNEDDMADVFRRLLVQIISILRREERNGVVPITRFEPVRREIEAEVQRMYLVPTNRRDYQSYEMIGGRLIPLSPVMRVLWSHIEAVTRLGVQVQAGIIRKALKDAPDVLAMLEYGSANPFYNRQPAATLPGRDNQRLKDKIQRAMIDNARKVDLYLAEAFALGISVNQIEKDLEQFLSPNGELTAKNKPYGSNAISEIMGISRGDLTRNYNQSQIAASDFNGFVESFNVIKMPGICNSNCQEIADGGPYNKMDVQHMPPFHKGCFCRVTWNNVPSPSSVMGDIRASGPGKFLSPLRVDEFTRALLDSEYKLEAA